MKKEHIVERSAEQVTNSERERLFNACTARRDMPERIAETFNKFRKSRIGELEKLRTATTIHTDILTRK